MAVLPPIVARDIDGHIDRVLADLRGIRPPLPLDTVCDLLKVDLRYYSAVDVSKIDGMIHKLRIASHQIVERPRLVIDVIRKLDLKGLWLPDQRRIAIASDLPSPKQRWAQAHEITHSLLPWHETYSQGDQSRTLRLDCHSAIEAEANYGASRLLFMGEMFEPILAEHDLSFADLQRVAKQFGNSLAATHWRVVSCAPRCIVGCSSELPWTGEANAGAVRHMFMSPAFASQFGSLDDSTVKNMVNLIIVKGRRGGPCGEGEATMLCKRGERHVFKVSCFNNQHAILTIATYLRPALVVG